MSEGHVDVVDIDFLRKTHLGKLACQSVFIRKVYTSLHDVVPSDIFNRFITILSTSH